jgi:hypothetical protein
VTISLAVAGLSAQRFSPCHAAVFSNSSSSMFHRNRLPVLGRKKRSQHGGVERGVGCGESTLTSGEGEGGPSRKRRRRGLHPPRSLAPQLPGLKRERRRRLAAALPQLTANRTGGSRLRPAASKGQGRSLTDLFSSIGILITLALS